MITFKSEELLPAMDRISATPDGRILKSWLQSIMLYGIAAGQNSGAVHEGVGRLNLARELIDMMDKSETHGVIADKFERPSTRSGIDNGQRGSRRRVGPADATVDDK